MARSVKPRNSSKKRKSPTKSTEVLSLNRQYLFEYGVNFKERIITISEEIGEGSFDLVDAALQEMESLNKKPITIRIKSPGGSVYEAIAIVGRIKSSPCPIITEGYGMVMSAATMLLSAGTKRRVSRYTWFMHHESAYSVGGRHSEVKAYVAQAEREEQVWAVWMAELTKKNARFWASKGIHTDAYFTAEQLVELGVADEVF
jgi:ATP-dependent Clp protease protease subunit